VLADGHGDTVLIVFAMANQAQFRVLDPQRTPRFCWTSARLYSINST
jgi:hypothetical protein